LLKRKPTAIAVGFLIVNFYSKFYIRTDYKKEHTIMGTLKMV